MIGDRFCREVRISKEQANVNRQLPHPCRHCSHVNTEGQVHGVFTDSEASRLQNAAIPAPEL